MSEEREIRVVKGAAGQFGNCLACRDNVGQNGTIRADAVVYEVEFHTASVRVCEKCRKELIAQLKRANKGR